MSVSMKSELSNMSREPSSMAFRGMGSGDTYVGGEEKEKEWGEERRSRGRREEVEEGEKEWGEERRRREGGEERGEKKGGRRLEILQSLVVLLLLTSQRSRNLLKNTNAMFSQSTAWCEEQEK